MTRKGRWPACFMPAVSGAAGGTDPLAGRDGGFLGVIDYLNLLMKSDTSIKYWRYVLT